MVTAINEVISSMIRGSIKLRNLSEMLVEIDDQSLLSRILIPEMVEVAKMRYPHSDPSIDDEAYSLISLLYKLSKAKPIDKPIV